MQAFGSNQDKFTCDYLTESFSMRCFLTENEKKKNQNNKTRNIKKGDSCKIVYFLLFTQAKHLILIQKYSDN